MKVLVLGAGVIGTTTAWFLREHGHEVTVVERQSAAALETSYANGGQISVPHVEPWAAPKAHSWQILKWLSRPDAPLLFRPTLDPRQWRWGIEFLLECLPSHTRWNMRQILAISKYSGEVLRELRAATGIHYDDLQRGILQVYTDDAGFASAPRPRRWCAATASQRDEVGRGVRRSSRRWRGGATGSPEGRSPRPTRPATRASSRRRSPRSLRRGVCSGTARRRRDHYRRHWLSGHGHQRREGVRSTLADASVACSRQLRRCCSSIGVTAMVYLAKGYSATMPIVDSAGAPQAASPTTPRRSCSRGWATGCAWPGRRALRLQAQPQSRALRSAHPPRRRMVRRRHRHIARRILDGLRPATPSGVPLIGKTRHRNLVHQHRTRHAGLDDGRGFRKALADIVSGVEPKVAFDFQRGTAPARMVAPIHYRAQRRAGTPPTRRGSSAR